MVQQEMRKVLFTKQNTICLSCCEHLKFIEKAKHCGYGEKMEENVNRNNHKGIISISSLGYKTLMDP